MLQCVEMCCSVETHTRMHSRYIAMSAVQCVAVCCSVGKYVAVCCNMLQCRNAHTHAFTEDCDECGVLQCVAVYCSEL